jgi:hypothetical protein
MRNAVGLLVVAALAVVAPAREAGAGEYYFALVFGSQSHPKQLRYTHTWATFVRAVGEGPDLSTYALEVNNISWLPRTLNVKVWRPWPEPGVNLDLYTTLAVVARNGESVTMWGPFVTTREVYERSLQSVQLLNSGAVQYRAIDGEADLEISDCIHAVTSVDPVFGRGHYPLIRIGKPASRFIARRVIRQSAYNQYLYNNSWLIPRLGLDRYPIEVVAPQQIPGGPCVLCLIPE